MSARISIDNGRTYSTASSIEEATNAIDRDGINAVFAPGSKARHTWEQMFGTLWDVIVERMNDVTREYVNDRHDDKARDWAVGNKADFLAAYLRRAQHDLVIG